MREFSRARRIGEQIQRELSDLIVREVSDPRLHAFTISGVDVTRDLSTARIYITPQAGSDIDKTLRALDKASGFLRHGLAQRLRTRAVPRLRFVHDITLERAERLSALLEDRPTADAGEVESPDGTPSEEAD